MMRGSTNLTNRSKSQTTGEQEEGEAVLPITTTNSTSNHHPSRQRPHRCRLQCFLQSDNLLAYLRVVRLWIQQTVHDFRTDIAFRLGILRIVFYSIFYYIAQKRSRSPLAIINCYEVYSPELFRTPSPGLLSRMEYISPPYLRILNNTLHISWWCCILGVGTKVAQIVTAILLLFFHGYTWELASYTHECFLPCYVSIALCFLPTSLLTSRLSVDSILKDKCIYCTDNNNSKNKKEDNDDEIRSTSNDPASDDNDAMSTSTCYWLILMFTVYFYFAAGMTKLQTSGLQWLDGASIAYELSNKYKGPGKELLMSSFFTKFSAFGAIFTEFGAPLAFYNQTTTRFFLILWSVMHVIIRRLMGPYYFQNINCFLWLFAMDRPKKVDKRTLTRLLTPMILFLFSCVMGQVLYWPITTVYMYSPYFNFERGIYANHLEADYLSREGLQRLAVGFQNYPSVPDMMEYSGNHMILYHSFHKNSGGDDGSDVVDDYRNTTRHDQKKKKKQWKKTYKKQKVESLGTCHHKELTHGHYRDIMRAGFTNETLTMGVLRKMQPAACRKFRPRYKETTTKMIHSLKLVWEYYDFTTDLGEVEFECL